MIKAYNDKHIDMFYTKPNSILFIGKTIKVSFIY